MSCSAFHNIQPRSPLRGGFYSKAHHPHTSFIYIQPKFKGMKSLKIKLIPLLAPYKYSHVYCKPEHVVATSRRTCLLNVYTKTKSNRPLPFSFHLASLACRIVPLSSPVAAQHAGASSKGGIAWCRLWNGSLRRLSKHYTLLRLARVGLHQEGTTPANITAFYCWKTP